MPHPVRSLPHTSQKQKQGYEREQSGAIGTSDTNPVHSVAQGSTGLPWTPLHDFQLEESLAILETGKVTGLKGFTRPILVKLCLRVFSERTGQFSQMRHGELLTALGSYVCERLVPLRA